MELRESLEPDAFDVKVAELLVATADSADYLIDGAVPEVLRLLRERMQMDVVFVSEFVGGERLLRSVEQTPGKEVVSTGQCDPLQDTWCERVVDGRLPEFIPDARALQASGEVPSAPFPIGTYLSTPIVLQGGEVYGTLCCISFGVNEHVNHQDLKKLQYTAQLTAGKIQKSRQLSLEPLPEQGFKGKL